MSLYSELILGDKKASDITLVELSAKYSMYIINQSNPDIHKLISVYKSSSVIYCYQRNIIFL